MVMCRKVCFCLQLVSDKNRDRTVGMNMPNALLKMRTDGKRKEWVKPGRYEVEISWCIHVGNFLITAVQMKICTVLLLIAMKKNKRYCTDFYLIMKTDLLFL